MHKTRRGTHPEPARPRRQLWSGSAPPSSL